MLQTLFNKTDLLKAFVPLSQNGQTCLEILLIHPKTHRLEGRGYFNDPDFVVEACTPLAGRYNFGLSPFAYAPERVPNRQAYNQFDRTLLENQSQENGSPHSLSVFFQFKPDLFRELDPAKGNRILQVVYLIDGILERIPLKTFCLDLGASGMTARFLPACAGHYPQLTRAQYLEVTRKLIERVEKEMFPQEHKKFGLAAAALGKAWDPLPGTPLMMGGEEGETQTSSTAGALQIANDPLFQQLFEDAVQGPRSRTGDVYAPANLQGLSQNWEAVASDSAILSRGVLGKSRAEHHQPKEENKPEVGLKDKRFADELQNHFRHIAQNRWLWPLPSQIFQRHHRGIGPGEALILQCLPFGAKTGLHYLMQAGEAFAREGGGQILVFSKRHSPGDFALAAMARHLKHHPFAPRQGQAVVEPAALAEQFTRLFPCAPIYLDCAANENWEHVIRYLEHDYLVRSKKNGAQPIPLAIVIDGAGDFAMPADGENFRQLAELKSRLRDVNAALWLLDPVAGDQNPQSALLGLADYRASLDFDGTFPRTDNQADAWEFGFTLDPAMRSNSAELALVRLTFQAHGSHRHLTSSYVHWGPVGLFKELPGAPAQGG